MLHLYNSLSKTKTLFHPIETGKIKLYVCGLTPYDYAHIGHARTWCAFDVMVRYLRSEGYEVTYVRNFTDIDDKIILRANENNEPFYVLTERFMRAMHEDMAALNVISPDIEPLATRYIDQMQQMIQVLIDKDYAYIGDNGDVYYRVKAFEAYGRLANKTLADLQSGSRVSVATDKTDPFDFVLWKQAKPSEPSWDSPWGKGRPGWHIECSAMSKHCLGEHIDMHGGGGDLKFPHHENEIAQSEAANDQPFVNYWIHTGMVNVNQEKMSKSLHNFFTIKEVLETYRSEVVRYFLIASHYRSQVDYSADSFAQATAALNRFYTALRGSSIVPAVPGSIYEKRFKEAMDDDFNTPEALAVLFDLTHEIHRARQTDEVYATQLAAILRQLGGILGLLQDDPERFLHGGHHEQAFYDQISALIAERNLAREQKEWAKADEIRKALTELGVSIEDGVEGTSWRKVE
jgi:cysteinyl-tRNA synthetase